MGQPACSAPAPASEVHGFGPTNFADWVALVAVVIPLAAFAISAWLFVRNKRRERLNWEAQRVQDLVTIVNNVPGSEGMAVMLMAVSELERYRCYRQGIIRAITALRAHHVAVAPTKPPQVALEAQAMISAEAELLARLTRPRFGLGRTLT